MQYRVTIGIPVYNIEKYVSRMIESALSQTFQSIEFLVVDDCGTDGSMEIIKKYQREHPRGKDIRIVRQPKNMGIGNARNRVIDEAQGQYLYYLDGDDYIVPNTIQLLYDKAIEFDAEYVQTSYMRVEEFGKEIKESPRCYHSMQFLEKDEFASWVYQKYNNLEAMTWNILIRLDVYRKNGLYYQPVYYWEDFSFTMDLPTYITRAVLLSDITYYYYCRKGSLSHFQGRNQILKDEIERVICAINQNKDHTDRLRSKPYFPGRMYKLMMTDFYIVCSIIRNSRIISPSFTKREMRNVMWSPLTFCEIIRFRYARMVNLLLYTLSVLPPWLAIGLIKIIGSRKKLI